MGGDTLERQDDVPSQKQGEVGTELRADGLAGPNPVLTHPTLVSLNHMKGPH